ncbi:MAG TPA: DUF3467 domain-containing protein [Longilinea sp.]|nr:DUF3467 domain-containing protein [Longilinea sp.]
MTTPANNRPPIGITPPMEFPPDLKPQYVNIARISHSIAELVMDFARMLPGQTGAEVLERIIMAPIAAKAFYRALGENIARYEATFGPINLPGGGTLAEDLFRSPHSPETKPPGES